MTYQTAVFIACMIPCAFFAVGIGALATYAAIVEWLDSRRTND